MTAAPVSHPTGTGGSGGGPGKSAAGRPPPPGYPVNLVLSGRRVVVVGGGRIAARKVEGLVAAGASVHVVAPRVGDELRKWQAEGAVTVDERPFEPSDLDGAWLAVTATDDPEVNRAVYEEGERRRMFVNAADDPANCSVTLMSVVRRGDLQIAVGTGGRSPALAAHLKEHLASEIGPEYGPLLDVLSDVRDEIRARGESSEGYDWRPAFDSAILDLVRAGRVEDAKERLRQCLSSSSA